MAIDSYTKAAVAAVVGAAAVGGLVYYLNKPAPQVVVAPTTPVVQAAPELVPNVPAAVQEGPAAAPVAVSTPVSVVAPKPAVTKKAVNNEAEATLKAEMNDSLANCLLFWVDAKLNQDEAFGQMRDFGNAATILTQAPDADGNTGRCYEFVYQGKL